MVKTKNSENWLNRITDIIEKLVTKVGKLFEYIKCLFKKEEALERCTRCNKIIREYKLFALQRYDFSEVHYTINDEKIFCSKECLDAFCENNEVQGYDKKILIRCPTYYECLEIDNLRRMCQRSEDITPVDTPFINLTPRSFCDPANAGLVKSAILLHKQAKKTARETNFQFKITLVLTVLIVLLTVMNILIATDNKISSKLDEIIKHLNNIEISFNTTGTLIESVDNKEFNVNVIRVNLSNLTNCTS
jgi:hypothetical protein